MFAPRPAFGQARFAARGFVAQRLCRLFDALQQRRQGFSGCGIIRLCEFHAFAGTGAEHQGALVSALPCQFLRARHQSVDALLRRCQCLPAQIFHRGFGLLAIFSGGKRPQDDDGIRVAAIGGKHESGALDLCQASGAAGGLLLLELSDAAAEGAPRFGASGFVLQRVQRVHRFGIGMPAGSVAPDDLGKRLASCFVYGSSVGRLLAYRIGFHGTRRNGRLRCRVVRCRQRERAGRLIHLSHDDWRGCWRRFASRFASCHQQSQRSQRQQACCADQRAADSFAARGRSLALALA